MIAMRYGTIPVATATGGLRDTIIDADNPNGTGFLFKQAKPNQLAKTLKRALEAYEDKNRWQTLQLHGMTQNFSWEQSARKYHQAYQSILKDEN
jgi:starch synthase